MSRTCPALLVLSLAACRPAPPPPPVPASAATPGEAARPAVPAEMTVVPNDPRATYRHLLGEGETPAPGGRVVRHLESDLNTLNPILLTEAYERFACFYLFDPLVDMNQKLEYVPGLAESWEAGADHRSTTLHIRKGVQFHDGQPLTARDVCFSFDMVLDPKVPAINWRSQLTQLKGCSVVDEHTVRLDWKTPYAPWLAMLYGFFIVPEHVYRVQDTADFAKNPAGRAPVGSGPFQFDSWDSQSKVVVKRFDGYWGPKARLDETVLKIIDNRETALKACQAGELDEQYVPSSKWFGEVAGPGYDDFNKVLFYTYSFNAIVLNNKNPLFRDRHVRQALRHADNSEGIVKELYNGLARPLAGPFNPDTEWADPSLRPRSFDLALAARLLEGAGWKDSNGNGTVDRDGLEFEFEILYPAGNTISEQTATVFQQDALRIGVKITMRGLEGATFFDRVNQGNFVAASYAWQYDPDPESVLTLFDSRNAPPVGVNSAFYSNPEVDRLIDASRAEFDHARRVEIVRQIDRLLYEDVPFLIELQTPYKRIFRKSIRGIAIGNSEPFVVTPGAEDWWLVAPKGAAAAR